MKRAAVYIILSCMLLFPVIAFGAYDHLQQTPTSEGAKPQVEETFGMYQKMREGTKMKPRMEGDLHRKPQMTHKPRKHISERESYMQERKLQIQQQREEMGFHRKLHHQMIEAE